MAQFQVYFSAKFLFDMMVEAANWSEAAETALRKFQAKGGIEDRMVKAFAPGDYVDGEVFVNSIYQTEKES